MRILWIRNARLVPVHEGGRIRSAFTIRELQKRHEVTLVSPYMSPHRDLVYEALLETEFPGTEVFWQPSRLPRNLLQRVRRQLKVTPVGIATFASDAVAQRVEAMMAGGAFDVAVADFLGAAIYFPSHLNIPSVLFEHNVESVGRKSEAKRALTRSARAAYRIEAVRLGRYEARQVRRFHHTVAVSEEDARLLRGMSPGSRVTAMATGVDLEQYRPSPIPEVEHPLVVYTGHMDYIPNVDAVRWFCAEIWPQIIAAVPAARFRIVGRRPARAVLALASDSIEVTGEVDEIAPHLQEASAVVVPLRAGSGTRLKVFEAMASGRPLVSTTLGAAGLGVRHGSDIVLADDARTFSEAVIRVLTTPVLAAELAAEGTKTASRNGWAAVVPTFERVLEAEVESWTASSRPS